MRRSLSPTIVMAALGILGGAAYRYAFDIPAEANAVNYLRSGVHGMGVALAGWAVHLYFVSRGGLWTTRWPLAVELVVRSLAIAIAVAAVALALQAALYAQPIEAAWFDTKFPRIVGIAFAATVVAGAVFELTRLVGGRVLVNVVLGRYRRPVREERVLMFLDLVGSTALAEAMGELRTHDLLTRFFFDIDAPIFAHGGEIHAYVGDEVIVSWPRAARATGRGWLDCFFAIEDCIAARAEEYRREFAAVPEFRASLHAGPVVISECGNTRRQIAYFGDTMNVAARIQEHCKETGWKLLVSAALMQGVHPGRGVRIEPLGPVRLRGRTGGIEVFAVERDLGAAIPAKA